MRRRFWDLVSFVPQSTGYAVFLDDRPLRLPSGDILLLPTAALAAAVAEEWRHAGGEKGLVFGPDDLVLTRLAGSLQERVAGAPEPVVATLLKHAGSDLLCYRAAAPVRLVEEQEAGWQPWLDWLQVRHGVRLQVTSGVMPIAQDPPEMARLRALLLGLPTARLTGLAAMVPELGSLVLGLAVADEALEPKHAMRLARLDHAHQARLWGTDDASEAEAARIAVDVALAARFMTLARSGTGQAGSGA